jgi:hypothetical protein
VAGSVPTISLDSKRFRVTQHEREQRERGATASAAARDNRVIFLAHAL